MGSISRPSSPSPSPPSLQFDPTKHLSYQPPSSVISLADVSLPPSPISPVASSVPFPLLSQSAIHEHRKELFSADALNNCLWHKRPDVAFIRGAAPRYAPFVHQFWTSPEVLAIVSSIAGEDLVPVMDYEICHTNVQVGEGGLEGVRNTPVVPPLSTEQDRLGFERRMKAEVLEGDDDDSKALVSWHRDSHPFVCVVMLSNSEFMTDGETELQKGDGTTMKVRSPQMGHAVILQGRSVSHIARPAGNMKERITIVTSFRPRDPRLYDDSSNMNVRGVSTLNELYYQWTSYRLRLLSERFAIEAQKLDKKYEDNVAKTDSEGRVGLCRAETVDVNAVRKLMAEQVRYMERTVFEMRPVEDGDHFAKNAIPAMDEAVV
ncbi:hypothetical protein D0Z07_2827 [Hyphodiscus hymeniophilus]|uniref:Fe2OG dioxygenase domain-containing protein n=1 Tax=Hyphodiscus hymeniophilus TaxID=353542 RepID=A0A9P6VNI2_9HELO|nr:hypothetical protein D0Z07_2827 [Hyphodiscus hymeniophilus]